ncbi:MAG: ABC transporter ATP-binding protein [Deltaproteobacteria bacterium]|nr:ABC transporter ATP-binding protein [Deltaproteobacteria bacterium]
MATALQIENLAKEYRLGSIGHGALYMDLKSWWCRLRGKEDPNTPLYTGVRGNGGARTFWALKGVSLSAEQGKVLGIIGRNGAGKSTLLKIISRITAPTIGEVKIKGRVASLLEVGTGFHPELTGAENVFLNGAILGMTKAEVKSKFDEIVDFSGVGRFIGTPVKRYSSGMYVRLAFAVGAHLEPEILLVDEVLAVGDAGFQKKCLGKMDEVSREGRTVLFVSHNLDAVSTLCDRVIWLDEGQIFLDGPAQEVAPAYLDAMLKQGTADRAPARLQGKMFYFKKILPVDAQGEFLPQVKSGGPLTLKLDYVCRPEVKSENIWMTVVFGNNRVSQAFSCPFEFAAADKAGLREEGSFTLTLPFLPLVPGVYEVRCAVFINGLKVDRFPTLLRVEENVNLQESDASQVPHHKPLGQDNLFLVDYRWSLDQDRQG